MTTSPQVSVVMSVYNGAESLRDSVESVLSQEAGARATESGATRLEIHRAGLGWAKWHGRCELQAPDCSVVLSVPD